MVLFDIWHPINDKCLKMTILITLLGSITNRCSENEPTLLPFSGRSKTGLEKTAEIEPITLWK